MQRVALFERIAQLTARATGAPCSIVIGHAGSAVVGVDASRLRDLEARTRALLPRGVGACPGFPFAAAIGVADVLVAALDVKPRGDGADVLLALDDVAAILSSWTRSAIEYASDPVLLWNDQRVVVDANDLAGELLQAPRAQLIGRPLTAVFAEPPRPPLPALARAKTLLVEGHVRRADGALVPVDVSTRRTPDGRWFAIVRDVTVRRAAEDALRASESSFRMLIEQWPNAVLVGDATRLSYANAAAVKLFGYASAEALKRPWSELASAADADALSRDLRALQSDDGVAAREYRFVAHQGRIVVGETQLLRVPFDGVLSTIAVVRDRTEQKQIEATLAFSERMAAIGTLAAGVAHEINNPLAFVATNVEWAAHELERTAAQSAEIVQALREAGKGAERVRRIVADLKTFARSDDDARRNVELIPILESCVNVAKSQLGHRVTVVRQYEQSPTVHANESRLAQVFLNLIVNAAQSMTAADPADNVLTLRVQQIAGHAVIEVRDTGCGIPLENRRRIFDPFFTTKPPGVGTGLGLSICHALVRDLGGSIEVESELEEGSVFRVLIKAALATKTSAPAPREPSLRPSRPRVVVIDDEPMIGASLRRVLSKEHEVDTLTSAKEVVAAVRKGRRWDLVISDLMMPEMTGMELHALLAREAPDLAARMIFLTGGAFTSEAQAFVQAHVSRCIHKPMRADELRRLVRAVLDGTG